ncbi:MAG: arsM [Bacteroidetes bacterium]|nr:arsM [Bacteroidota bacterium]
MKTNEEIKHSVRKEYTRVVTQATSCCGPGCCGSTDTETSVSRKMNERYEGVDSSIVATADLGLGCGTPTAFAGLEEGMTVLDLGSGAGIDVFVAAQTVGPTGHVIGVDMTDAMLEKAERNRIKLGIRNAEFRKGEIESLPVDSASIDRIISNCVINLVPDKRRAFAEISRVLKSGGKFIVSDIVTTGTVPDTMRENMRLWADCISGAVDKEEYLAVIREAGFHDIRILTEKAYDFPEPMPFGVFSITLEAVR